MNWQSVDGKKPKSGRLVLVSDGARVYAGYYDRRKKIWRDHDWIWIRNPIHWAEIPAPPALEVTP